MYTPSEPDHFRDWLTLGGVIGVALIAAATAQWRLRQQLRHDRELKDLEVVRNLLEEAAAALRQAATTRYYAQILYVRNGPASVHTNRHLPALRERREGLEAQSERIAVHLGRDDPAREAYQAALVVIFRSVMIFRNVDESDAWRLGVTHGLTRQLAAAQRAYLDRSKDVAQTYLLARESWWSRAWRRIRHPFGGS